MDGVADHIGGAFGTCWGFGHEGLVSNNCGRERDIMHSSAPPWVAVFMFLLIFVGMGSVFAIWTDKICDWQIGLLQSRTYRSFLKGMGVLFMALGLIVAAALATGTLS